jgi:hypothetical protein
MSRCERNTGENTEMPQCEGSGKASRHSQTTQVDENDDIHHQVILTYASALQWVLSINGCLRMALCGQNM